MKMKQTQLQRLKLNSQMVRRDREAQVDQEANRVRHHQMTNHLIPNTISQHPRWMFLTHQLGLNHLC